MKKIMIIGAGLLQSFLIKKAKEMGYTVICVDGDFNAIGFKYADHYKVIDIKDKRKCLEYAKEMKIEGVLTAATDYGVLTVAYIAEEMNLVGNLIDVCKIIKNKYLFQEKLKQNKIENIEFFIEISDLNEIKCINNKISYPIIVKPCDGSGSRGVKKVDSELDLEKAVINALDESLIGKVILEKFVEGKEYGVECFVNDFSVTILLIMEKIMTESNGIRAELGHNSFCKLSENIKEKIKVQIQNIIRVLGIKNGAVNLDIILSKNNEISIVDIGLRMGGNLIGSHIVPLATGIDYMELLLKQSLGEEISIPKLIKMKTNISSRLLVLKPGRIEKIKNLVEIENCPEVKEFILTVKENDLIKEYQTNLDSCGYILVEHEEQDTAESLVIKLKERIDNSLIKRRNREYSL